MEQEFVDNNIPSIREEVLPIFYKGKKLKHKFNADFTLFDNIIVEVKSGEDAIIDKSISQTLNFLRASGSKVGLIINFGKTGVEFKRLIM